MENVNTIWSNRPVLVTGGAGFIGSWLAEGLLEAGANVFILDTKEHLPKAHGHYELVREKATYIQGDVRDEKKVKEILSEHNIGTVFHLAAEAIVDNALSDPGEALDTNIRGTWTVLEAVRQTNPKIPVVIASSDKAYGAHETLPYTEDFPLVGKNPYDCTKSCADLIAQMYIHTYNLPIAVTRCGNVYGGGDLNFSRLIPDTIRSSLAGRPVQIRSDGMYKRDYVFVGDIVAAYMSTAEALISGKIANGVFNFGTGLPQQAIDVVTKITKHIGTAYEPVILNTASYEIKDQYLDATRAHSVLGWHPRTPFEVGIIPTVVWYREFLTEKK